MLKRLTGGPLRWYPVGLAGAYLMHVYLETGVHPAAAVRSVVLVLLLTIIVQLAATRILRSADLGALATSAALVLVAGAHPPIRLAVLMPLLVVVSLLIWWMVRQGRTLTRVGDLVQGFTVVLLVLGIVRLATSPMLPQLARDLAPPPAVAATIGLDNPDFVVILLDAYPGRRTLERVFGLDDDLAEALRARGFDVADGARSNYSQTVLTMSSMLGFGLLAELPTTREAVAAGDFPRPVLRGAINDAPALHLLRDRGYRIVATASGWEDPALRSADDFLDAGELNEFELSLIRSTAASDLLALTGWDVVGDQLRARYRSGLAQMRSIADTVAAGDGPTFAFVHLPVPHAPIVFDGEGGPVPVDLRTPFDYGAGLLDAGLIRERYRAQLPYLDATFLDALDATIASLPKEAVIAVFSDHGPRSRLDLTDELRLREAVDNLIAVRTPGRADLLPDDVTTVNVLPILFDAYLGTDLPRSADRSFVSFEEDLLPLTEVPAPIDDR
jgi:hypothetical protein